MVNLSPPSYPIHSLLGSSFSSFSHRFCYRSPLLAPTSAPFILLATPSQSSCKQERIIRSCTYRHRSTNVHSILRVISKLVKQFSSIPLISFAKKHILKPQVSAYSSLITEISLFVLLYYVPQLARIVLLLLMARASHLWTAVRLHTHPATHTTSSFRSTTFRAMILFVFSRNLLNPLIVSLAVSSFSFLLADSSLFLRSCHPSSPGFLLKPLWLSTSRAAKIISFTTAQFTTALPRKPPL